MLFACELSENELLGSEQFAAIIRRRTLFVNNLFAFRIKKCRRRILLTAGICSQLDHILFS